MAAYLAQRLAALIPVWLGISVLAFGLANLAPGDPASMILQRLYNQPPTVTAVQALREELGLNDPLPVQYGRWLIRALGGDFGRSYRTGEPVLTSLAERFPATLQIAATALLIGLVIAVPLGAIAAVRQDSLVDHLTRLLALAGASLPPFWLGYLLIMGLAVHLKLLPVSGRGTWQHLVLPALTLGLSGAAGLTRLTRSTMLEVLQEDYVRTGRAKGLSELVVVGVHALKNAMIPVVTVLGLRFGYLLGGAVIVETVFAWPGIGKHVVDAIFDRDYPTIQGFVLFTGAVFVVINLIVDLLYVWLDPRVRLGATS